jgi:phage terminase large subunit-like protein
MYEQRRVHHIGNPERFADLENEMTTWTDDERWSPNRLDAVVWALTFLSTAPKKRKWAAR